MSGQPDNLSGEGVRVAYPLFQTEGGGSSPTSPLQLEIVQINIKVAQQLNELWHSRLPIFASNISQICFGAVYECVFYASAIWSNPISRELPQHEWLELRRLAIAPDAPKNTASRMLRIMALIVKNKFPHIKRLISYQDATVHKGTIYQASGWIKGHEGSTRKAWNCISRPRPDVNLKKERYKTIRWEKDL